MPAWYIVCLGTVQKVKWRPAHLTPHLLMRHFCILQCMWSLVSTMTVCFWFSHRPPERGYSSAAFIGSFPITELLAAMWHILQQIYHRVEEIYIKLLLAVAKRASKFCPRWQEYTPFSAIPFSNINISQPATSYCTDSRHIFRTLSSIPVHLWPSQWVPM